MNVRGVNRGARGLALSIRGLAALAALAASLLLVPQSEAASKTLKCKVSKGIATCVVPAGPAGPKGNTGAQGPKGDAGVQGPAGRDGLTGTSGLNGRDGKDGAQGATGATGATGAIGATGPAGPIGVTGAQGLKGGKGDAGINGTTLTGAGDWKATVAYPKDTFVSYGGSTYVSIAEVTVGEAAPDTNVSWALLAAKGVKGDSGATGAQGAKGDRGNIGPTGPRGLQGDKGDKGDVGPSGISGSVLVTDTVSGSGAVNCPVGHPRVFSGGASVADGNITETRPTDALDGWTATGSVPTADITIYAVCGTA